MTHLQQTPPHRTAHATPSAKAPRTLDSAEILGDAPLVLIVHQGETYRLQTTRQGKLILTK